MSAALAAGLLAGFGIAVPVGAVAVYLVTLSARTSARVGLAAALGVATVDAGYALLAVLGGAAAARRLEPLASPLRWTSVTVLLALAGATAVSAARTYRRWPPPSPCAAEPSGGPGLATVTSTQLSPTRAFLRLLAITAINPTTLVYFAALVGARSGSAFAFGERLAFVVGAFAASAGWHALLAGAGAAAGRSLVGRRARLFTGLASSAVITILALRFALQR